MVVPSSHEQSYSMWILVFTETGDHFWAGIPPQYVTKPTSLTQPCIPPGLWNQVPDSIGWVKVGMSS